MEKNSQSSREPEDAKQCISPTVAYLLDKLYPLPPRKTSIDSQTDRTNFCLNFKNNHFTVLRVYINATSSPSIKLYYTKFTPAKKCGQICIVHGYGECSDDYIPTAEFFAKQGYIVHMLDLRGHGYSGGDRVNQNISKVMLDIETLLNCCERGFSTFIITQGLSSIFINSLFQQNRELPIAGVIQISPLIKFIQFTTIGANWRKLLLSLSPMIFSNLLVHNKINPTALTKSPYAIKAKIDSVFFQSFMTLKMAAQYDDIAQKATKQAYKFGYPCLVLFGSCDSIQNYDKVKKYVNDISSSDKSLKIFQGAYHDMHLDEDAIQMRQYILGWIRERSGGIKWKPQKTLDTQNISKNYVWKYVLYIIGLLILLLQFIKRTRKYLPYVLQLIRKIKN